MIKAYNDFTESLLKKNKGLEKAIECAKTSEEIDKVFDDFGVKNLQYRVELLYLIKGVGYKTLELPLKEDEYDLIKSIMVTYRGWVHSKRVYKLIDELQEQEKNNEKSEEHEKEVLKDALTSRTFTDKCLGVQTCDNYTKLLFCKYKGLEGALKNTKTTKDIDKVFETFGIKNLEYRIKILNCLIGSESSSSGVPPIEQCTIESCYSFDKELFLKHIKGEI